MPAPPMSNRCKICGAETTSDGTCPACMLDRGWLQHEKDALADGGVSLPGSFVDYEILQEVARGGMGVVYKARQRSLNRIVAIKMILAGPLARQSELDRFKAEAETAARLQHPNIVAIHEVGEFEGQPFFSMEYVEGQSLAQLAHNEPLPAKRAAAYLKTIAEAVAYAHSKGVLHRDLKPSNILLDQNDQPRITDFGLAKRLDDSELSSFNLQLTLTGQVLGSPNFMPPEQATGDRKSIGPASDVYSLGAILYQLLTGRPPFMAETLPLTLRLVSETDAISPRLLNPSVPQDLETICLKCLEKSAAKRYGTARELVEELNRFLNHQPIRARPISPAEKFTRWVRRHPAIAALASLTTVLLVTIAVLSTVSAARLQRANQEGQEKLRESLLQQARANRWSGRAGRRFESLEAIRKAVKIRPGMDLRDEAIAAMSLVDLHPIKTWDLWEGCLQRFDGPYECYARSERDGTVGVRRVRDEREVARWPGFGVPAASLKFSPDGRRLGVYYHAESKPYAFKIYNVYNQRKLALDLPDRWVRSFSFSTNGQLAAIAWQASQSGSHITIYELTTGRELSSFPTAHLAFDLEFSPDATRLAASSTESARVHLYSVPDGVRQATLVHSNTVTYLSWAPDGHGLAASCNDHQYYIWNLSPSSPATAVLLFSDTQPGTTFFTQRADMLLSCGSEPVGHLWDLQARREIMRFPTSGTEAFSRDDHLIATHATAFSVSMCEFADGEERRSYHVSASSGDSHGAVISPNGLWMASAHKDGVRLWDLATATELANLDIGDTPWLQFSSDGRAMVTGSRDGIRYWPVNTLNESGRTCITFGAARPLIEQPTQLIHPTNRMFASGDGKAYVFDATSLRIERRFTSPGRLYYGAVSPDGRYCATYTWNAPEIELWDLTDGQRVRSLPASITPCLGFSPDGRWFVTGFENDFVFWETGTWIRRKTLPRGEAAGTHGRFAFTSDAAMVALFVGHGNVAMYDTRSFELLATLEPPEPCIISGLDFSRDGSRLAVSTTGKTIYCWNLRLVREELAAMNIDFDRPPLPPAKSVTGALEIKLPSAFHAQTSREELLLGFAPRDPGCTTNQIDLTAYYNAALTNSWVNPRWEKNDLSALPRGLQVLDTIKFDVRGLVQLTGTHRNLIYSYPNEVKGIRIRQCAQALHFIHAVGWEPKGVTRVGEYVLHYRDGVDLVVPLEYAQNIARWSQLFNAPVSLAEGSRVAWRGSNPPLQASGYDIVLYHFRLPNPRVQSEIATIDFRSANTDAAPFLLAITVE
jgi:serine/threonine protein kinase/WD40 repeat protein